MKVVAVPSPFERLGKRKGEMTLEQLELVAIDPVFERELTGEFDRDLLSQVVMATKSYYEEVGFVPPWIGYVALSTGRPVGTCGFKGAPVDSRIEIAYFTFPGNEGQGLATEMARHLIALAQEHDDRLLIAAQTLPERNASHRVLEKLGFSIQDRLVHPTDGEVLEWNLCR